MPHPFDWTVLDSHHPIRDRWISVRADRCRLPDGRTVEPYYVLEYPTWVNVLALTPREEVVLVRLYRHGIRQTVLELPSGTVEPGESPLEAMRRELREETGYGGGEFTETGRLSPNPANHANRVYSFVATGVEPIAAPVTDPTEQIETVLVPLPDFVQLARSNQLFHALHVGALFLALDHLGRLTIR